MNCNYDRVVYRMKVRQRISSECSSKMELVELTLKDVKGVRMNVTGFGLLNWIAGKTVSNLIQETVLQVTITRLSSRSSSSSFQALEDQLTRGIGVALENTAFYFQPKESLSCSLYPAGIITCQ